MLLEFYTNSSTIECGVDEAGRGCLCGGVFASAVILPKNFSSKEALNDSKKLNSRQRDNLRKIIEKEAISFSVGFATNEEIDQINILKASFLAMQRAILGLKIKPDILLIDGNRFVSKLDIPYYCIVKGDQKYQSIAAASILAKTYRDEYITKMAEKYPQYLWNKNKGYPTKEHRMAIKEYGITPLHRKTFNLLGEETLF
ncbi:MAG: ribonuclease HII [Bacteroidales bacterium]|jgi:ribonuclease HII|nr:ribonuclease HII [Bacteroidales bacterium]